MITSISHITIVVEDADEALEFYVDKLGFVKRDDHMMGEFRWLTISPEGQEYPQLVLYEPNSVACESDEELDDMFNLVGAQPPITLVVDDLQQTYTTLTAKGVKFVEEPVEQPWGKEAALEDLYGNPIFLLEPK